MALVKPKARARSISPRSPGRERPKPGADRLDRMGRGPGPLPPEARIAGLGVGDQVLDEASAPDLAEDPAHLGSRVGGDDPGAALQGAELGGVRGRLARPRGAAR